MQCTCKAAGDPHGHEAGVECGSQDVVATLREDEMGPAVAFLCEICAAYFSTSDYYVTYDVTPAQS